MGTLHPDEVPVDAGLVRQLLAEQHPQWAGLPLEPVPGWGTDNALYRLGDVLVVRLPRIGWAAGDVAVEQQWLPRVARVVPVAVPEPVAVGKPGAGYPWAWSVYRWLPGRSLVPGVAVDDPALGAALAEVVRGLARLAPDGGRPAGRGGALAERDADTRPLLPPGAERLWDAALAASAWPGPPRWVHGDLAPGNLLVDDDGALSAVIDWGSCGAGDPACDLAPAWTVLGPRGRAAFRDAVGLDDATWARGRGWALSVALLQLDFYAGRLPALEAVAALSLQAVLGD